MKFVAQIASHEAKMSCEVWQTCFGRVPHVYLENNLKPKAYLGNYETAMDELQK